MCIYFLLSCNILWPRITQHFLGGLTRFPPFFLIFPFFFCLWPQIPAATVYLSRAILPCLRKIKKKTALVANWRRRRVISSRWLFCLCAFPSNFRFPSSRLFIRVLRRNVGHIIHTRRIRAIAGPATTTSWCEYRLYFKMEKWNSIASSFAHGDGSGDGSAKVFPRNGERRLSLKTDRKKKMFEQKIMARLLHWMRRDKTLVDAFLGFMLTNALRAAVWRTQRGTNGSGQFDYCPLAFRAQAGK